MLTVVISTNGLSCYGKAPTDSPKGARDCPSFPHVFSGSCQSALEERAPRSSPCHG